MDTQYDAIARDYAVIKSFNLLDAHCLYASFYKAIGDVRGKSVLDLATGTGKVGYAMLEAGAAGVLGVDESEAMIAIAKTEAPEGSRMEFLQKKISELGQIGQFDVITSGWGLHYSTPEDELKRSCKVVAMNLKPNGIFVALNSNPNHPLGGCEKYGYEITAEHKPLRNGDVITVTCFGNGEKTSFQIRYWSLLTYINAMREAGLHLELLMPAPTPEGIESMGAGWWDELKKHPTSAIFKCTHIDA